SHRAHRAHRPANTHDRTRRRVRTFHARRTGGRTAYGRLVGPVDGRTRRRSAGIHRDGSVLPAGVHVPRLLRVLPASPRRRGARPRGARAAPGRVRDGRWRLHAARRRPPTGPDPSRRLTRRRDERRSIGVLDDRGYPTTLATVAFHFGP